MTNFLEPQDDGLIARPSGLWAAQKLDYLARYIDVFENAMFRKWPNRNYIDVMAGPGKDRIRGTRKILLGSPLLALMTPHPFTGYYFIDLKMNNTNALRQRCDASAYSRRVNIYTGDCNDLVDLVVARIKSSEAHALNLAFLDPEGFELKWSTVAKLASIKRMDLIINYPEGGLNRYIEKAFETNNETAIDSFFGDREWRKIYREWLSKPANAGLHRRLIDHYKNNLKSLGYNEVVRGDEVIIEEEPLMRNTKSAPLYRLLFASKHALGHDFWHKITRRNMFGQTPLPF